MELILYKKKFKRIFSKLSWKNFMVQVFDFMLTLHGKNTINLLKQVFMLKH